MVNLLEWGTRRKRYIGISLLQIILNHFRFLWGSFTDFAFYILTSMAAKFLRFLQIYVYMLFASLLGLKNFILVVSNKPPSYSR